MSNDLSLSGDRTFVHITPALENARSASTDEGGIVMRKLFNSCRLRPRFPFVSKTAISLVMAANIDFSTSLTAEGFVTMTCFLPVPSAAEDLGWNEFQTRKTGFRDIKKPGFRFWKISGLPGFSVSVKTGLQSLLMKY